MLLLFRGFCGDLLFSWVCCVGIGLVGLVGFGLWYLFECWCLGLVVCIVCCCVGWVGGLVGVCVVWLVFFVV